MALGETELASLFLQLADGAQLLKGEPRFLPRRREEDGSIYEDVWDVFLGKDEPAAGCAPLHGDGALGGQAHFILKRAKDHEAEIYRTFFSPSKSYAPRLWASAERGGDTFLLLEYVEGENLQRATMRKLAAAINSLRAMQDEYWGSSSTVGLSFETSFASLKKRRQYLLSPLLERHFDEFLSLYEVLPKTLCHADLLPFNLIVCRNEERAVLLDWEAGGILPYPESLARLIAHGRTHGELFRMTPRQRVCAAEMYYARFASRHGISHREFARAEKRGAWNEEHHFFIAKMPNNTDLTFRENRPEKIPVVWIEPKELLNPTVTPFEDMRQYYEQYIIPLLQF